MSIRQMTFTATASLQSFILSGLNSMRLFHPPGALDWTILLCFCFLSPSAKGKDNVLEHYEKLEFKNPEGQVLRYRWHFPDELQPGERVPLLIFLHGAGERGDDNEKTLVHGARDFVSGKLQSLQKCAVLIPQCPEGQQWVNVPWIDDAHTIPKEASDALKLVKQLMDEVCESNTIDKQRIYLTGLSMGGFGVWDLVSRYPNQFAAVVAICGGGDSDEDVVTRFKHVPIWVFHGDADETVKVKRSRDMVAALNAVGGHPKYTEYANTGHNSWTVTYANPELYRWILSHRRKER